MIESAGEPFDSAARGAVEQFRFAPASQNGEPISRAAGFVLLAWASGSIWLARNEALPPGPVRTVIYRTGIFLPACLSYFLIGWLNPALDRPLLDAELMAVDQALFTITPSIWLQRFNHLGTIEWFSFFYYSYFYLMALMVLPALFAPRGRPQAELLFGSLLVACVGHSGYTLVPGYGPYHFLEFGEPVAGGFWWDRVLETVLSGGAMMDIFPSLHTAYPIFFALHSFSHRSSSVHRFLWPALALIGANIVVATLLLRWHWGIDVIVGLLLAVVAHQAAVAVVGREYGRESEGRQRVWEPLRRASANVR